MELRCDYESSTYFLSIHQYGATVLMLLCEWCIGSLVFLVVCWLY